jgi:lactoylglutathione lyase
VRSALKEAGIKPHRGRGLRFADPWGNEFEIVEYGDVQFTKAPEVLRGMGLSLEKTEEARKQLAEKGLG